MVAQSDGSNGVWPMGDRGMSYPEAVLEFRLSSPNEFTCSRCPQEIRKGSGTFAITADVHTLIVTFMEHVGRCHAEETAAES